MQQFADGGNEIVLHLVASRVDRGGQTGVGLVDGGGDPVQGLIQLGLHGVDGVSFTFFEARDVVRHPLVARIVNAYEARDAKDASTGPS